MVHLLVPLRALILGLRRGSASNPTSTARFRRTDFETTRDASAIGGPIPCSVGVLVIGMSTSFIPAESWLIFVGEASVVGRFVRPSFLILEDRTFRSIRVAGSASVWVISMSTHVGLEAVLCWLNGDGMSSPLEADELLLLTLSPSLS